MKKNLFVFCALILAAATCLGQSTLIVEAPQNNASTSGLRAPNGTSAHAYQRACFLVLASELSNIPVNTGITSFGYTLNSGVAGSAVTGNYTLFLEHTNDNTYQKGTNFATAVTGMTSVYANVMTIPVSVGTTSVMVNLSSTFTYTGGGLYVAYDWQSNGPFSTTSAIYLCESVALNPGGASAASTSAPPATLGTTAFRPAFLFGFSNPFSNDMQVLGIEAPGRVAAMFNTSHVIQAHIKNGSSAALNNVNVSLNVTGANLFTDVQQVSLAAGASSVVSFAAFNPQNPGLNTLSVTVPSDQNNINNSSAYSQSVTCNEWAQNPATGSYTSQSVGFDTGEGVIGVSYLNPVTSTLSGVRVAISTNTQTIGKSLYGSLLSATGATLAASNPITITSAMLGTFVEFTFPTPYQLAANTSYLIGCAQTLGSPGYHPFGTQSSQVIPSNIYGYITNLAGGPVTILTQNFGYFGFEAIFTPTITLAVTPQTVTCGSTATMQAVSSTNYSWSTGATSSSITVNPTVSTVYTVVATNTMGCINSKTVSLNITPLPVNITASSNTICLGDQVTLSATGASSYTWSAGTNPTAASINDSPTLTTVYTVTGSIPAGCSSSDQVVVAVQNFSTLGVSATTHTICEGNSAVLVASGADTYTWSGSTGSGNAPTYIVSPPVTEVFTVTGADPFGCTMQRTVTVNVIIVPLVVSNDTAVCFGSAITLTAAGANSYVWDNGSPFHQLAISSVTVPGSFTVTGTGAMSCSTQAVVNLAVNPLPTVEATPALTSMCTKESNIITASGASTYSWSTGQTTSTIVLTPSVNLSIHLTLYGFDQNNCKGEDKITIAVSNCVGLSENSLSKVLRIFPNPGSGLYLIESDESGINELMVYNTAGSLVKTGKIDTGIYSLDISSQPAGVYVVMVFKEGVLKQAARVVKQ